MDCLAMKNITITTTAINTLDKYLPASNKHYYDAIMGAIASQITSLTIVYSTVYSDADQSKHQSSASLAFVREIHRGPVNFPHKWPVTRKMFPFDDVIMKDPDCTYSVRHFNSSLPGQNGHRFTDDTFRYIFLNDKICTLIKISLKCILRDPIENNPALVSMMTWRQTGDKPLSEPMLTRFLYAYMRH